ncbi:MULTISPECIES: YrrS family protein [Mesobacillus]|nr:MULTISPECIES: YrrS family protein [Mesobacillus]MDQ0414503.1 cytoskeletal protein RodZ [Mesobacillus stamsii]
MKNDYDSLNEGMRSRQRAKRRKTNLILNSLIVIVILLIGIVSYNIFFSNEKGAVDQNNVTAKKDQASASPEKQASKNNATAKEDKSSETSAEGSNSEKAKTASSEEQADPVVTEGGSDANVKQTIENPGWKPVGTTQTGDHTPAFDESTVDWQEMILAYSYATGIDKNNMTLWWNENGGAPNTAVGTISEKGSDQTFRVWIQWVDGEGWKPVKVEELIQNDKR